MACRQNEEEEARRLLGVKFEGAAYKPTAVLSFRGLGGKTPLHAAAFANAAAIARALLDAGANVDSLDGYGNTSLLTAAQEGHLEVVKVRLERGAAPGKSNAFGDDAAAVARRNGTRVRNARRRGGRRVARLVRGARSAGAASRRARTSSRSTATRAASERRRRHARRAAAALAPALVQTAAAPPPAGGVLAAATASASPTPADGVIRVAARPASSGASAGSPPWISSASTRSRRRSRSRRGAAARGDQGSERADGRDGAGPLPEQVRRLVEELGLELVLFLRINLTGMPAVTRDGRTLTHAVHCLASAEVEPAGDDPFLLRRARDAAVVKVQSAGHTASAPSSR